MGERPAGVGATPDDRYDGSPVALSPRSETRRLEGCIAVLRDELSGLIAEVDRRRHEALDVKLQVRRHALETTLTAVALVGAAAGFVWLTTWRARKRQRLTSRADRLRQAVARMIERPERVAAEPTVPVKIVTAAANAAVATLVKKLLERLVPRVMERRGPTPAPHPSLEDVATGRRTAA